jgi:hypothetical protein
MNTPTSILTTTTLLLATLAVAQGPATQPASRAAPSTPVGAAGALSAADATSVIREGTYIVDRSGRIRHAADGQQWEFRLDPGPAGSPREAPVLILPNLNLMLMENAVTANARDVRFKITGMVTEYRGRNYVLLQKVVVVPEAAP